MIGTAHVKIIPEIDPADLDAAIVEAIAVRVAEILAHPYSFPVTLMAGQAAE
ncbi:hypothetical protein [Cryobacterium sp. Y62]|uniref:hypothetical protein n=1 Tax=Cryobacterium sp. Y62 TaxID=2048284 RepID=UPI001E3D8EBC|nr:hypothetical protein [Cryobacterium sp. Y62]